MFCTNCGKNIPDNSQVCGYCGAVIGQAGGQSANAAGGQEMLLKKSGKKGLKIAILAVAAVLVIGVAVLAVTKILGGNDDKLKKQLVYLKNNALYYVENMDKGKEGVRIVKLEDDRKYVNFVYSSDMKYIYFVDDTEGSDYGTLYRFPLSKASKKEDKNKELIEEIESKVNQYYMQGLQDGSLLYRRENGKLYWFTGKESIELIKDVSNSTYDKENDKLVCTVWDEEKDTCILYHIKLDKKNPEKLEIDEAINDVLHIDNTDFITYYKDEDEETGIGDLYVAGVEKEPKKIAADVYDVVMRDSEKKIIYYTVLKEETKKIYDYIEDSYAETDADMVVPEKKNYLTEIAFEQVLTESDYTYYIEDYPEDISYFYDWLYYDDDMEMYYYTNYDGDEERIFYYNELSAIWYEYNWKGYEEAYEAYKQVEKRIAWRNDLKEATVTVVTEDVYKYTYGEEAKLICEGAKMGSVEVADDLVYYTREKNDAKKVKIEDVLYYDKDDIWVVIQEKIKKEELYCIDDGQEYQWKENGIYGVKLSDSGKQVAGYYEDDKERCLWVANISKGQITDWEVISKKSASIDRWIDETLYYVDDIEDGVGTLCTYTKGKKEEICDDVVSDIVVYNENFGIGLEAEEEFEENRWSGDLCIYNKNGERTEIESDVSSYFVYEEDRIIFMTEDEDLYLYNGKKENKEIADNVDSFCVNADLQLEWQ